MWNRYKRSLKKHLLAQKRDSTALQPSHLIEEGDDDEGYHTPDEAIDVSNRGGCEDNHHLKGRLDHQGSAVSTQGSGANTRYRANCALFDATFRTNFVQIDILGHDDTDKVKFIFMASNIVFGMERKFASESLRIAEKSYVTINEIYLEKVLDIHSNLRLLDSNGSSKTPWLKVERHMNQASDQSRHIVQNIRATHLAFLLDHELVATIFGFSKLCENNM